AAGAHLLAAPRRRLARDQRRRHDDDRHHARARSRAPAADALAPAHGASRRPPRRMSEPMELTIALRGVVKRFGDQYAVRSLDLDIAKGSFFSILGPSGCGKTTPLRMIAGFEQPDEGHILLEGQPVENVPPYRRNVNT